jgi:hypothetical protein
LNDRRGVVAKKTQLREPLLSIHYCLRIGFTRGFWLAKNSELRKPIYEYMR